MPMQHPAERGMMGRAVAEAVATVAAPELADRLVANAVQAAGLPRVPESPAEAAAFVNGPLRRSVARALGDDLADMVVEGLGPVVEVASGFHGVPEEPSPPSTSLPPAPTGEGSASGLPGDRLPGPARVEEEVDLELDLDAGDDSRELDLPLPEAPSPPPLVEAGRPAVLVATLDRAGVGLVGQMLREVADVRPVADMFEWMAGLETFGGRRLVLVLDCCVPAVDPLAAAQVSYLLPPQADVVLWGASADVEAAVLAAVGDPGRWHRLPADTSHRELAERLRSGL
ncbi:MAG TPA: hypothetical protein RMF84_03195 [Polyangiaceae bacterium LLY-WYZ-14_1]|nr:hypothetical protein [Polyangiaceae bacterium LLY-WYZ-14_1]